MFPETSSWGGGDDRLCIPQSEKLIKLPQDRTFKENFVYLVLFKSTKAYKDHTMDTHVPTHQLKNKTAPVCCSPITNTFFHPEVTTFLNLVFVFGPMHPFILCLNTHECLHYIQSLLAGRFYMASFCREPCVTCFSQSLKSLILIHTKCTSGAYISLLCAIPLLEYPPVRCFWVFNLLKIFGSSKCCHVSSWLVSSELQTTVPPGKKFSN